MARKIDLDRLQKDTIWEIGFSLKRLEAAADSNTDYLVARWMSAMTAVELHAIWERFVEKRLVAALNHNPSHFIQEQQIKGVTAISSGFASFIVRGGGKFFDFRSIADLYKKSDPWLSKTKNPFRAVAVPDAQYIDTLAAIRNCVVHGSDASVRSYKEKLRTIYNIKSAPEPDEFLYAIDYRETSPLRYARRINGLAHVLSRVVKQT